MVLGRESNIEREILRITSLVRDILDIRGLEREREIGI